MSFGLKNAGATYQRVMSIIFRDHLRKMVEFYVDDIAVKSRSKSNHLADLRTVFNIMRAHQLKMNLTKSFLGVLSGKFLRYCHIQRDSPWPQQSQGHSEHTISEDPQKAQRSLQGTHLYPEIHYKSFGSLPIVHMVNEEGCLLCMGWSLPKGFWGCQGVPHQASGPSSSRFREIVLALCATYGPFFRRSAGTEERWKLRACHLLPEQNFDRSWISIQLCQERVSSSCLRCPEDTTLLGCQTIRVISRVNPLHILMTKLGFLNSRLANWDILLSQYDMTFVPLKGGQRSSSCRFLATHPVLETSKLHVGIPDEIIKANVTS